MQPALPSIVERVARAVGDYKARLIRAVACRTIDCIRWLETGMRSFEEEAGSDPARIDTGGWGSTRAVTATLHCRAMTSRRRRFPEDSRFPATISAIARG